MGAPAGDENAADWCSATAAGLARAQIDAVFKLEKTADSVGVNII